MTCPCRCHLGGPHTACNHDSGYGVGCGPHEAEQGVPTLDRCILAHDRPARHEPGLLVCRHHRRAMDNLTSELALLIADANLIRDGGAPQDEIAKTRHVKKRADPPAPGDVLLMSLFDPATAAARIPARRAGDERGWSEGDASEPVANVLGVVASWLLLFAEERPLTETRHKVLIRKNRALAVAPYEAPKTLPRSVLAQLGLLERHHDWAAAQPWVDDYLLELGELQTALRHAVNDRHAFRVATCDLPTDNGQHPAVIIRRNRAVRVVLICGGPVIVRNGEDVWRCGRCKATWVTDQQKARFGVRQAG